MTIEQQPHGVPASVTGATAANTERYRLVIVGLGSQGAGIADEVVTLGHDLVGAVDIAPKAGRNVREFTTVAAMPELIVSDDLEGTLRRTVPDLVILAPALPLDPILEMAGVALDLGIDVLTLQQDVLSRDDRWAAAVDARARVGGASLMASGVQDVWWVQLPALVAASSLDVTRVRIGSEVSLEQLSRAIGEEIGVMLSHDEFAEFAAATADYPSVLGAPMVEAARRMGLGAGPVSKRIAPIFPGEPYEWRAGGITIPVDRSCGFTETIGFTTDRGIRFEGTIAVQPKHPDDARDELRIDGRPDIHLVLPKFPGHEITNTSLIARIPDVIAAPPGVLFAAEMPPPRHQLSRRWQGVADPPSDSARSHFPTPTTDQGDS